VISLFIVHIGAITSRIGLRSNHFVQESIGNKAGLRHGFCFRFPGVFFSWPGAALGTAISALKEYVSIDN
jgi:hypothetical protein